MPVQSPNFYDVPPYSRLPRLYTYGLMRTIVSYSQGVALFVSQPRTLPHTNRSSNRAVTHPHSRIYLNNRDEQPDRDATATTTATATGDM